MAIKRRRALVSGLTFGVLCQVACSFAFAISPTGQLDQSVVFRLYDIDRQKPYEAKLTRFMVLELNGADKGTMMWHLEGGSRATETVTYGQTPPGLRELMPAKPLTKGSSYRVFAQASGPSGAGSAVKDFMIDGNGTVQADSRR